MRKIFISYFPQIIFKNKIILNLVSYIGSAFQLTKNKLDFELNHDI